MGGKRIAKPGDGGADLGYGGRLRHEMGVQVRDAVPAQRGGEACTTQEVVHPARLRAARSARDGGEIAPGRGAQQAQVAGEFRAQSAGWRRQIAHGRAHPLHGVMPQLVAARVEGEDGERLAEALQTQYLFEDEGLGELRPGLD